MASSEQIENDKADIASAMEAWATAFSGEHPETILAFYAADAVLWGTLSPVRRDSPAAIRDYFEQVFSFAERKVTFHDPLIRIFGNTFVNTGSYTFSWVKDGQAETIPARYSFTYVKRNERWRIVDHPSSVIPTHDVVT